MKFIKTLTLIAILSGVTLFSCKEEEKTVTPVIPKTKTELLTSKTWKMSARTNDKPIKFCSTCTASTDLYVQMTACEKDDTIRFFTNSTSKRYAVTKCTGDQAIVTDLWGFADGEKILSWESQDYTIKELTESKMVLNHKFTKGSENYDVVVTYTH